VTGAGGEPPARAGAWRAPLAAVLARPHLWPTAARQVVLLAPRGWWHRPPFLPVPERSYRRFRALTQYGDSARIPSAVDVVGYLEWCRQFRWLRTGRHEHHPFPPGLTNCAGARTALR
jgi:hypothetical protein